ncbi:MAG: hypothetical protein E6124_22950 [Blautia producta]|uniref:Uncharacterized protein n=2 Tax=Blautia producta TaxID=33035 RepID=A0A7G5MZN9_9FIRM|nr:hypothetical protein [Blautia producta]MDU5222779.1 hypothetical protein [Blautia producta]MDU5385029.1 hypothetical protein [Blautia producta]MDU6885644.1 hypothetical protein [Blautia producta]QIB57142.1 hypothetical protein GXM18_21200 [Blautia producta ATCC 27340 = DSM 2950]QMW80082.1 hypothetical protein E5259_22220 [Blautia producta]
MNIKGTRKKNQVVSTNIFEQQEMIAKMEAIRDNLQASAWHELKTQIAYQRTAQSGGHGNGLLDSSGASFILQYISEKITGF